MSKKNNKRGVAILLVLTSVVVLTTLMVEFARNTMVALRIAQNEAARLKATYLAKSALGFMYLELKFDRTFQETVQKQNLGQYIGGNVQLPLCQQFPMSTGLIRAVFLGGGLPGEEGAAEEGGEKAEENAPEEAAAGKGDEKVEDMQKDVSISQEKDAQEFLQFEGDFDGECTDEGTKINLNGFAGLSSTPKTEGTTSPLDQYKLFIIKFLSQPQFELLFEVSGVKVQDVVDNIADWIDENAERNEFSKGVAGAERAAYDKLGVSYQPKNGRLLTLMEAYQIDGVVDDWFGQMMDYFTVYGDGKVNPCTATEDVLQALIKRYVDSTPSLPPVRLEAPEEMAKLVSAVTKECSSGAGGKQLAGQIATALDQAIGAVSTGAPIQQAEQQQQQQQQTEAGATTTDAQAEKGFAQFITTERRFFSLKLTGAVNDTVVRIKAVVDTKDKDPKKWKLVYWRVY